MTVCSAEVTLMGLRGPAIHDDNTSLPDLRGSIEKRRIINARTTTIRQRKWQDLRKRREDQEKLQAKEILEYRRKERARLNEYIHSAVLASSAKKSNWYTETFQDKGAADTVHHGYGLHAVSYEANQPSSVNCFQDVTSERFSNESISFCQIGVETEVDMPNARNNIPKVHEKIITADCLSTALRNVKASSCGSLERAKYNFGNDDQDRSLNCVLEQKGQFEKFESQRAKATANLNLEHKASFQNQSAISARTVRFDGLPANEMEDCTVNIDDDVCPVKKMAEVITPSNSAAIVPCLSLPSVQEKKDMNGFMEDVLKQRLANEAATTRLIAEVTALESRLDDCCLRPPEYGETSRSNELHLGELTMHLHCDGMSTSNMHYGRTSNNLHSNETEQSGETNRTGGNEDCRNDSVDSTEINKCVEESPDSNLFCRFNIATRSMQDESHVPNTGMANCRNDRENRCQKTHVDGISSRHHQIEQLNKDAEASSKESSVAYLHRKEQVLKSVIRDNSIYNQTKSSAFTATLPRIKNLFPTKCSYLRRFTKYIGPHEIGKVPTADSAENRSERICPMPGRSTVSATLGGVASWTKLPELDISTMNATLCKNEDEKNDLLTLSQQEQNVLASLERLDWKLALTCHRRHTFTTSPDVSESYMSARSAPTVVGQPKSKVYGTRILESRLTSRPTTSQSANPLKRRQIVGMTKRCPKMANSTQISYPTIPNEAPSTDIRNRQSKNGAGKIIFFQDPQFLLNSLSSECDKRK